MANQAEISTWRPVGGADFDTAGPIDSGLAVETPRTPDPAWETCLDALLSARSFVAEGQGDWDCPPNLAAIDAALAWAIALRKNHPGTPPTLISPEAAGGIVLDCETIDRDGAEILVQLTFRNNGFAEWTTYRDRKVVEMFEVPFRPPHAERTDSLPEMR